MQVYINPDKKEWPKILSRPALDLQQLDKTVTIVFDEVKSLGDRAVKKNTKQFDKVEVNELRVSVAEFEEAERVVPKNLKNAIDIAKNNI
ncbi:MAG TPA: histidinol dehydrogenase, partial [Flavobacteriales bacterium]|nr:histidinol dehydrogenase [Flavobacteriales bacterium]